MFGVPDESWTSRGVPEWSRGEELYIGSAVSAIGKVSGVTCIVPGPPEGSRGSTGWGHLSRRAPWAEVGKGTSPWWAGAPPLVLPLRLRLETLGVGGAPPDLGGKSPPPLLAAPLEIGSLGGWRPPGPLYKEGGGRAAHPSPWRLPLPPYHLSLSLSLAKPCRDCRYFHHHAVVLLDLHQPLLPLAGSRRRRRLPQPYVC